MSGFSLILRPGLRRFVVVPLLINIFLFALLFLTMRHYFIEFNQWADAFLPHWLHWMHIVLWLMFVGSFFLVVIYVFVVVANIICAPFNTFLAEKVELYLTGQVQTPRTFVETMKDIPRSLGRQLNILGYYLPRAFAIFCLLFVPVLQAPAALIWFLFHAWFMTMTYVDYPSDNARASMQDVRGWMANNRWSSLGFGAAVLAASMVPVLNFFTIPAAVAGATRFWLENK